MSDDSRLERVLRADPITDDRLNRLPLLLTRSVVMEITGLSKRAISELVRSGKLSTWKSAEASKARFYKVQVLQLVRVG